MSDSGSSVFSSSAVSLGDESETSEPTKVCNKSVDEELLNSLNEKLTKHFDSSMGSQVGRLTTILGLFGELTL